MNNLKNIFILVLLCAVPVVAQGDGTLLLPIEMPGYYSPAKSELLAEHLKGAVQKTVPNAQIRLVGTGEMSAYDYQPGSEQPPSVAEAQRLTQNYGTANVAWITVQFNPEYDESTGKLAMAAAARLWVYSFESQRVIVDSPISLLRFGDIDNIDDEAASLEVARGLAIECMDGLATYIGQLASQQRAADQKRAQSWQRSSSNRVAAPAGFKPSSAYHQMTRAAKSYMRASSSSDLVNKTQSEETMNKLWLQLNAQEQGMIGQQYPGIKRLMNTQGAGGGYWPYYYRY
jgi:hypothetical protein